jgi:hypothetical protein
MFMICSRSRRFAVGLVMARVERDWRVELVLAYPDLFHPAGDPPAVQAFPDVGDALRPFPGCE